jgi:hypothetical protein
MIPPQKHTVSESSQRNNRASEAGNGNSSAYTVPPVAGVNGYYNGGVAITYGNGNGMKGPAYHAMTSSEMSGGTRTQSRRA